MKVSKYELFGLIGATIGFITFAVMSLGWVEYLPFSPAVNSCFAFLLLAICVVAIRRGLKLWFDYRKLYIALIGYLPLVASILVLIGLYLNSMPFLVTAVVYINILTVPISVPINLIVQSMPETGNYGFLYLMPLTVILGALIWTLAIGLLHRGLIAAKRRIYG